MKALTCEMCGSTNLIKEEGVFVCQSCGTKYSVEEAKKMMIDGTVEVAGTVKIDTSSELTNLYEIARRAKETDNSENALKYYDMILVKDPKSWEANFYVVYFRAMSCKIAEIQSASMSVANCLESVITLIKNHVTEKQDEVVQEIYFRTALISQMLYNAAKSHYDDIDSSIRHNYVQEYIYNSSTSVDTMYTLGNCLEIIFGDTYGSIAADAWKQGITMHKGYIKLLQDKEGNKTIINQYAEKIKKYDSTYEAPSVDTSSGCYIATTVYGSYDCPEVWTLRRFRDNTLAETWYGRLFISSYYATSPTIVKWFGASKWFRKIWRVYLNRLVIKLNHKGVNNTPYQDQ